MSFTATHYNRVAAIIRARTEHNAQDPAFAEGWHAATSSIREELSRMFASDNPKFDAKRFAEACEPKGGAK